MAQLQDVRQKNVQHAPRKAILLAVHYPPYSGAANFVQRGDPTLGPTNADNAWPLGTVLQDAFAVSGQRPDAVLSAHAHLYQRLTYRHADGWEVPYIIAGSGGHAPVENLWLECSGQMRPRLAPPFDAVLPPGLTLPAGESVQVVAYDDQSCGFMRLTVGAGTLQGEFFTAGAGTPALADSFCLALDTHRIVNQT